MKEVLDLVREFGLSLVVAVAASYALYKFFFFSIREVKATFCMFDFFWSVSKLFILN